MLLHLSHFSPFIPFLLARPLPPSFLSFSSCTWVVHISSLVSTFPMLFLTSPCLFSPYHLCYLLPIPSPPLSPSTSPLITFHVISISVILILFLFYLLAWVFCCCWFCFLGLVVNSCEFVVILLLIVFIFFFLDKSL